MNRNSPAQIILVLGSILVATLAGVTALTNFGFLDAMIDSSRSVSNILSFLDFRPLQTIVRVTPEAAVPAIIPGPGFVAGQTLVTTCRLTVLKGDKTLKGPSDFNLMGVGQEVTYLAKVTDKNGEKRILVASNAYAGVQGTADPVCLQPQ